MAFEKQKLPSHIAIIMDGNRRWAKKRGMTATQGHEAGVKALVKIVDHCEKLGIKSLTIYALSTENWKKRAKKEVQGIFALLIQLVKEKKDDYAKRGVVISVLGEVKEFPRQVRRAIGEISKVVKKHERMKVNVALNYGGRDELLKAVREIIEEGVPAEKINEKLLERHLYTNGQPDPDLVIRPGGEKRLSNFLLWQLSYAEIFFTDTLWPDFTPQELDKILAEYSRRQRRFGQ